jgi:hypothetical protein
LRVVAVVVAIKSATLTVAVEVVLVVTELAQVLQVEGQVLKRN